MKIPAKRTVLVVEDDPCQLVDCVGKVLRAGYIVHSASSAEHGIRVAQGRRVDAILTDNVLPGMSGLSSIAAYAACSRAPVLLMTSDWSEEIERDALLLGAKCCLKKPLDFARVRQELVNAVRKHERSPR